MQIQINSIGQTHCPSDWSWDTADQNWTDIDLWLVLGGRGTITTNTSSYNIGRGDCFVFQSDERYLGNHDPNNPLRVIHIHYNHLDMTDKYLEKVMEIPVLHRYIVNPDFIFELANRVLLYIDDEGLISQEANLWMKMLLKEIIRLDQYNLKQGCQTELEVMINQICFQINNNLDEHYRVKELAENCGYSHDYFSKVFKWIIGLTPEQYIIEKRIQSACGLLSESNMSITRISELLGYKDRFHFSKQFKTVMGKPPRAFRNNNKI